MERSGNNKAVDLFLSRDFSQRAVWRAARRKSSERGARAPREQRAPRKRGSQPRIGSRERWRHSRAWRSLSALLITETEEKLIAAAAIIGESSSPKSG